MRRRTSGLTGALAIVGLIGAAVAARSHDASACGVFFPPGGVVPSLSVEQVLLFYDEPTGTEHFVREVAFKRATNPFGFVVPTPSKPEVKRVADRPFAALARTFPFRMPAKVSGQGFGGGHERVDVVSVQRIGSFTVFVLSADDPGALEAWLKKHGFTTTAASKTWLEHYVALKFHFVAFRYEPAKDGREGTMASETVDISFKTPAPYYPYREPDSDASEEPRVVALWFISQEAMQPVAALRQGEAFTWRRPFLESIRPPSQGRGDLITLLGAKLSPALPTEGSTSLVVQVFQDQKRTRTGYGDVVFVPEHPRSTGEASTLDWMAPVLDPELEAAP